MCSLISNANEAKANLGRFAPFMLFAAKKKLPREGVETAAPEACGWEFTKVIESLAQRCRA
jgi:hypothetical protein